MMPAFNALAGLSPNWEAVLVQIEHCAATSTGDRKNRSNNTIKIKLPLAITIQLPCKFTQKYFDFTLPEISPSTIAIIGGKQPNTPGLPGPS
jgi:hypothetical protein